MNEIHNAKASSKPWIDNPHRLISWLTMNKFSAAGFYRLGQTLQSLQKTLKTAQTNSPGSVLTKPDETMLFDHCIKALELALQVGLPITHQFMLSAAGAAKEGASFVEVEKHIWAVSQSIEKEMDVQLFLYVPSSRAAYFDKDVVVLVGTACCERFPSVVKEIDEAMKCYAVGRYTACAFHLVRATEAGTKALGDAIGAKTRNNNWGDVFKEHDKQAAMLPSMRPAHWATHEQFLSDIGANLRAVKTLRNSVAHLDETYTEGRAATLLVMVPEFLKKLAERMDEKGNLL